MTSIRLLALLLVASCASGGPCEELLACGEQAVAACEGAMDPATVAEQVGLTCGADDAADQGGWQVRMSEAAGLRFLEAVPSGSHFDDPLPLLVWIHGRGDKPSAPRGPFYVDRPMRLVMPQGPLRQGKGYAWLPVRVDQNQTEKLAGALRERAAQVAAMLSELIVTRRPPALPIVAGFSEGGMVTFALAVHHSDVVGAAFPSAGWLPPPLWPQAADARAYPPIKSTHGTDDDVVPIAPTRDAVAHLRGLGLSVELLEFAGVKHSMTREMHAQLSTWLLPLVP
jgi:phospholipase/carboxylesterase